MEENNKGLVIGVVVILVLAVLFLLFGESKTQQEDVASENENVQEAEPLEANVSEVDLESTTGNDRLPEGFPTDTPVKTENILDAVNIEHTDGRTEAIVIYTTDAPAQDIYDVYVEYMTNAGYTLTTDELGDSEVDLFGLNEDKSIAVSSQPFEEGGQEVFVNFTVE